MAIALRSSGGGSSTTAIATAVPVGWGATEPQAGDLCILTVTTKPFTATIVTPTGTTWTKITEVTTGSTGSGTDVGSGKIAAYYHECDGTHSHASTSETVSITSGNSSGGGIIVYSKDAAEIWDATTVANGNDSSAGNYSATGGTFAIATGDWFVATTFNGSDAGTVSSNALSMSGATLNDTARKNTAVTTGQDSRYMMLDAECTAGSASTAPVHSYTNASAAEGGTLFVRLRVTVGLPPSLVMAPRTY